jgi:sulfur-oxidizing protein SoxZ
MGKPIKIRAKLKGDIAEVKALMPHDMESGLRRDPDTNELVPAHYITDVRFEHNGTLVMEAYWGTAVSKNPYVAFSIKNAASGDVIKVRWTDNHGDSSETETTLK